MPATRPGPGALGRRGARALATVAVMGFVAGVVLATAQPEQAAAASGACTGADGVTVVVDYGPLGGGVAVGCAPGDPATGEAALWGAGFEVEGTRRMPSFLCRIDGQPGPGADLCVVPPPPTAYWSYWVADRGGAWCYADVGMHGRDPVPGTVEGWVFTGTNGGSAPRSSTFTPVAGAGSSGADCDPVATATTAPPTTAAPGGGATSSGRQPAPAPAGATPAAPAAPGTVAPEVPGQPGVQEEPGTGAGRPGDATATTATTSPATTTTAPGRPDEEAVEGDPDAGEAAGEGTDGTAQEERDERAESTVALSRSGRSGPGSPVGTAVAVGAMVALGAGAFVLNRRRAASSEQSELPSTQ